MILRITLILFVTSLLQAQPQKDIKFYNLEKEYAETATFVYQVQNAQALELKQIITGMLSIYGSLYVNEKTNTIYITDVEKKLDNLKQVLPGLDVKDLKAGNNLVSRLIYLKHEKLTDVIDIIRHKLSPDGKTYAVPNLNALVVTDVSSKIDELEDLLNLIDVPSAHISLEITIIEFNNEDFSRLGINVFNWLQGLNMGINAGMGGPGDYSAGITAGPKYANSRNETYTGATSVTDNIAGSTVSTSNAATLSGKRFSLDAGLNISDLASFISENADGSVLASTRLITRNNKYAEINSLERIPYRRTMGESGHLDPGNNIVAAGISLKVTPTLQQDSLIHLDVMPVVSDLTGWSPHGMPIIFERSLNTEVKVKNNHIFVLGGLKKRELVTSIQGVPFFKDIPLLGYLFSVKRKVVLEREIMIFIKPSTTVSAALSEKSFMRLKEKYEKIK
ncbi:MAG: hypothetical protein HQK83_01575 [Fibrobacteria bacterium]|nr:hypothetical protein [Fibrobacteria bacterium]